jgi:surfactin synthase thioesterase subunit
MLHFAGGSSYSFDFMKEYLKQTYDIIPLELPGRGKRIKEDLLKDKHSAIKDYVHQIKALRNQQPYLIYGHSMGADLGFYVTKIMEHHRDAPQFLITSGNAGPGVDEVDEEGNVIKRNRYLMSDVQFKSELREMGGMPEEMLDDEDIFDFFNPIIRADFEILEKVNYLSTELTIHTPIHAIMGSEEQTAEQIQNWKRLTTKAFYSTIMEGNHFFIHDHPYQMAQIIVNCKKQRQSM